MSYSAVTALMDDAVSAMGTGDYATARDKALAAQALMSVIPDTTRDNSGGGSQQMTWDRVALSQFVDRVQRILNGSVGISVSKVVIDPVDYCGAG